MDGEIDLKSCVKVSEFDVEKNYGFQIQVSCWCDLTLNSCVFDLLMFHYVTHSHHVTCVVQTREAVFTLSAMTAGIRRNWIEVLKKCIRPSSSPDLTQ